MTKTERLKIKTARVVGATHRRGASTRSILFTLLMIILLPAFAAGQLPVPASSQFDVTGFIQSATLGGPGSGSGSGAHQGGFITVNGLVITVPSETIVILPANALTWQELFALAPAPYTGAATGMALNDAPAPLTTYEAHVIGNRVLGGQGGADVYIAGLIYISQQALNSGAGYINCINYATGEMRVGGPIGNCAAGARVQINDPVITTAGDVALGTGRYSRGQSPDVRFQVDQDNPTIASATGFPMCVPRVLADPNVAGNPDDAICPVTQRRMVGDPAINCLAPATAGLRCTNFTMKPPGGGSPDPSIQAPFEVGDWVTYAGTLVQDCLITGCPGGGPTAGPWPAAGMAATYISAHTINNNAAIYTAPGTDPAYVSTEVTIVGTGGLTVVGAGEATARTRFEGMTTDADPTGVNQRKIHLYGIDFSPLTGATADRDFGTIGVDPGPENGLGAVKGRWRFRPPCLPFGSNPTRPDKDCVMNASNTFLPPPREVRAVIQGAFTAPIGPGSPRSANGIVYGQYHAPVLEYIFPENVPGTPIPENNFNTIDFLAQGGYSSSVGTLVGQLNPWPSNVVPAITCSAAVANAGGPYAVNSGGTIPLTGNATGTQPIAYAWTATGGTFSNANLAATNYTAPQVAVSTTFNLTLTATNCGGSSSSTTTVTVAAASAPTVNPIPNQSVASGAAGSFNVTGSDPNVPAATPLTWTVSQAGAPALLSLVITSTGPTSATVSFTAPSGVVAPTNITLTVTATNTIGIFTSAPVTVTITPPVPILPPVANPVAAVSVPVNASDVSILITGSDPNVPAQTPLLFTVTQTPAGTLQFPSGGCALGVVQGNLCVTPSGPTSATVSFNAPATPVSVTLTITAINAGGVVSAPITTTITVTDVFSITAAEYRTNKQRLIVNVTDNTIDPTIQIFLLPYRCENAAAPCVQTAPGVWTYDPDPAHGGIGNLFTGGAGGLYLIDVVGAPAPACNLNANYKTPCSVVSISAQSSKGGTASSVLTRIR
ncbi:MAG TPA: hypothetical protein VFW31_12525 [Candidatus Angelobacter sp.]|nr:hypothetical protein [Candidatus Angelobacter sp.]